MGTRTVGSTPRNRTFEHTFLVVKALVTFQIVAIGFHGSSEVFISDTVAFSPPMEHATHINDK